MYTTIKESFQNFDLIYQSLANAIDQPITLSLHKEKTEKKLKKIGATTSTLAAQYSSHSNINRCIEKFPDIFTSFQKELHDAFTNNNSIPEDSIVLICANKIYNTLLLLSNAETSQKIVISQKQTTREEALKTLLQNVQVQQYIHESISENAKLFILRSPSFIAIFKSFINTMLSHPDWEKMGILLTTFDEKLLDQYTLMKLFFSWYALSSSLVSVEKEKQLSVKNIFRRVSLLQETFFKHTITHKEIQAHILDTTGNTTFAGLDILHTMVQGVFPRRSDYATLVELMSSWIDPTEEMLFQAALRSHLQKDTHNAGALAMLFLSMPAKTLYKKLTSFNDFLPENSTLNTHTLTNYVKLLAQYHPEKAIIFTKSFMDTVDLMEAVVILIGQKNHKKALQYLEELYKDDFSSPIEYYKQKVAIASSITSWEVALDILAELTNQELIQKGLFALLKKLVTLNFQHFQSLIDTIIKTPTLRNAYFQRSIDVTQDITAYTEELWEHIGSLYLNEGNEHEALEVYSFLHTVSIKEILAKKIATYLVITNPSHAISLLDTITNDIVYNTAIRDMVVHIGYSTQSRSFNAVLAIKQCFLLYEKQRLLNNAPQDALICAATIFKNQELHKQKTLLNTLTLHPEGTPYTYTQFLKFLIWKHTSSRPADCLEILFSIAQHFFRFVTKNTINTYVQEMTHAWHLGLNSIIQSLIINPIEYEEACTILFQNISSDKQDAFTELTLTGIVRYLLTYHSSETCEMNRCEDLLNRLMQCNRLTKTVVGSLVADENIFISIRDPRIREVVARRIIDCVGPNIGALYHVLGKSTLSESSLTTLKSQIQKKYAFVLTPSFRSYQPSSLDPANNSLLTIEEMDQDSEYMSDTSSEGTLEEASDESADEETDTRIQFLVDE